MRLRDVYYVCYMSHVHGPDEAVWLDQHRFHEDDYDWEYDGEAEQHALVTANDANLGIVAEGAPVGFYYVERRQEKKVHEFDMREALKTRRSAYEMAAAGIQIIKETEGLSLDRINVDTIMVASGANCPLAQSVGADYDHGSAFYRGLGLIEWDSGRKVGEVYKYFHETSILAGTNRMLDLAYRNLIRKERSQ